MWWGGESPRLARVLNFMEMLFQTTEANEAFELVFSTSFEELECVVLLGVHIIEWMKILLQMDRVARRASKIKGSGRKARSRCT